MKNIVTLIYIKRTQFEIRIYDFSKFLRSHITFAGCKKLRLQSTDKIYLYT